MEVRRNGSSNYRKGLLYAITCSVLWGILPIYWHALRPIESSVILPYRIFFVWFTCFVISLKKYGIHEIKTNIGSRKSSIKHFLSGLLIVFNWQLYVWAVNTDQVIQTCVGYYIEPLIIGMFGIVIFKENLTRYKVVAVIFAILSVFVIIAHFREIPLLALVLGVSFAGYAAIKKNVKLPAILSLLYETMYIAPLALIAIFYLEFTGKGAIGAVELPQYILMYFSGPITALTLALFSEAANKVSLVTLGMTDYIMPSISLLLGVFVFKEPFDFVQFISFVIVWIGLFFFTVGEFHEMKTSDYIN